MTLVHYAQQLYYILSYTSVFVNMPSCHSDALNIGVSHHVLVSDTIHYGTLRNLWLIIVA